MLVSVDALIDWFAERRARGATVYREKKGELPVDGVELSGIADRIEIGPATSPSSTSRPASRRPNEQVESGLAPQLLLEAAMLARGVYRRRAEGERRPN